MIPPSDPTDGLEIARGDLAQAVRIVAGTINKRVKGVSLRFEDGWLYIEAGPAAAAKAPACGTWPLTIIVDALWVRRLAKSIPPGDPVRLHVDDGRLYANRYSEPCVWTPVERPLHPKVPELDEKWLILEAATILKPLLVSREALNALVEEARTRGTGPWRQDEKKMISLIARAWELLAPLGVETADLRRLVDLAVRTAWK